MGNYDLPDISPCVLWEVGKAVMQGKNHFLFIPQEKKEKAHNKELEQKIKGSEAAHAASQELSWVS